ncbi:MAG TPA: hypothetical protein VK666_20990, partial [Chryseolinea sp.]|nr:hypothetical protein [Chryseolinea sp.]
MSRGLQLFRICRNVFSVCIALIISTLLDSRAQDLPRIVKAGAFVYPHDGSYGGLGMHAEYEMALGKTLLFSMGPRIEYEDFEGSTPVITIGYQLKYYPLAKHAGRRMQGPMVGLEATYALMDRARTYERYGPGLGLIVGYQHRFKKRLSLSFEVCPIYMKDLNDKSRKGNPEGRYWYGFVCIKAGISLGRTHS